MKATCLGKGCVAVAAYAAVAFGVMSMTARPAEALPPIGPLCGPSLLWSCSAAGGPDILFAGTVCDARRFERRKGVTCVPLGS